MSGPTVVALKVATADNRVTVKSVAPVVSHVTVKTTQTILKVSGVSSGPRGQAGQVGAQGPVGPQGPTGSGDLSYEMDFIAQSLITVNHNLGKYPSTTVIDSAGDLCEGFVDHLSKNTLTILFSASFSGSVICN